ncbi:MAG TPA: hypothetical protein VNT99_03070 [Methylomirabilota bacterium]|nr:hypothetical protein [Methylomirabilota bacterium]
MNEVGPVLVFGLFVMLVVAGIVYSFVAAKKRREELGTLAMRLGLAFSSEHDRELPARFHFLDRLAQGSNRYAYNVLSGNLAGDSVLAFDYHYETHSTNSKGRRQTHHHHFSFFILLLPVNFPELTMAREGVLSKMAQAFGFDDIDFESHEFSRKFCVRSTNKKFAYDVCHPRFMEYLLANDDLSVEFEGPALAIGFSSCLKAPEIENNLRRLREVRSFLPNYLLARPNHV